jgi:pimeloyl-ACP methyl ester carboxylesterase
VRRSLTRWREVVIPRPLPRERGLASGEGGCDIAWYRYGHGDRVVVFFPTWNVVDARVVGSQVEYLAERCTVITYDARGSGASDRPSTGYGFSAHVADGIAVLDTNEVDHAAVVTASRGFNPAAIAAVENPARIDRVAAVAPYVPLEPPDEEPASSEADESGEERDWFSDEVWRTDWPGFSRFFMQLCFSEPGSEALIEEMIEIMLDASPEIQIVQRTETDWARVPALLPLLTCPTLIIQGDSDHSTPLAAVSAIADRIPDAQLQIIPGGGHRPDIRTPDRVNPLLADFLLT